MPVLAELTIGGQPRKVVHVRQPQRLLLRARPRDRQADSSASRSSRRRWAKEIRADGRPMLLPNSVPSDEGTKVCPDQSGGTNWMPPSFDPALRLFFVTAREVVRRYSSRGRTTTRPGEAFRGGAVQRATATRSYQRRCARSTRRPASGTGSSSIRRRRWAGVLSTASGLVFAGDNEGNLMAFDAQERQEPLALPDRLVAVRSAPSPTCSTTSSTC